MPAADDPPPTPAPPRRPARRARCPICGRAADDARHRPFCSARCTQIDLGRWLSGGYVIPSEEEPDAGHAEEEGARSGTEA